MVRHRKIVWRVSVVAIAAIIFALTLLSSDSDSLQTVRKQIGSGAHGAFGIVSKPSSTAPEGSVHPAHDVMNVPGNVDDNAQQPHSQSNDHAPTMAPVNMSDRAAVLTRQTQRDVLRAPLPDLESKLPPTAVQCMIELPRGAASIADYWNDCLAAHTSSNNNGGDGKGDDHQSAPLELCSIGPFMCPESDRKAAAAAMRPGIGAVQRGAAVVVEPRLAVHLGGFDPALRPAAFGLVADLALRAALHSANVHNRKISEVDIAEAVAAATGASVQAILKHGWSALVPTKRDVAPLPANVSSKRPNSTDDSIVQPLVAAFDATAVALKMSTADLRARTARCFPLWYLQSKWQPARHHDRLTGLHAMSPFTPYYPGVVSAIETKHALAKVPKAPYDYEVLSREPRYEIIFHHPFPEPGSAEEAALQVYRNQTKGIKRTINATAKAAAPKAAQDVDASAVTGLMLQEFVKCVDTGTGLQLRVGPLMENCLVPTEDELALRKVGPRMMKKILNPPHGWNNRSTDRFSLLLRIGAVFWWRDDRMPGYLTPLTHWDVGLLEHNLAHVDVPVGCGAILLNMDKPGLSSALEEMQRVLRDEQQLPYRFMLHPENVGVSGAWNRLAMFNLAHEPTAQYVWITQPDIFISPTWFAHFDRYMHAHPEFAYVKFFHHASMGVTRKWLLEVGGFFDENVYPSYSEDVELWVRVRASGMPIGDSPVPVRHTHHISSSTLGADGSARVKIYQRWRRENYVWRKWGFDHGRLYSNPSGSDKRQFTKPFNSKVIPFNATWMILDQTHIDCIRTGKGPSYGRSPRHPNGCPESCMFDMRKVSARWPGAFDPTNQDPMNVRPPGPINSSECF